MKSRQKLGNSPQKWSEDILYVGTNTVVRGNAPLQRQFYNKNTSREEPDLHTKTMGKEPGRAVQSTDCPVSVWPEALSSVWVLKKGAGRKGAGRQTATKERERGSTVRGCRKQTRPGKEQRKRECYYWSREQKDNIKISWTEKVMSWY